MKYAQKLSCLLIAAAVLGCTGKGSETGRGEETGSAPTEAVGADPPSGAAPAATPSDPYAAYAGSASCAPCHEKQFADWRDSHHALAERPMDVERDDPAFVPTRRFQHGSASSVARKREGEFELVLETESGEGVFAPQRAFGVAPLRQYLVPARGGRLQATEVAYDPEQGDWFNVYGDEDRRPGEWGHWTGRGMNWNSMCAYCHNTALKKNYDDETDTYATAMAEMGVGCEACHGPLAAHVRWQEAARAEGASSSPDPTVRSLERDPALDTCGSCHSRRAELDDGFVAGASFLDHYMPVIADETDTYYADGQVHEEDFEFVSFLSSVMYSKDVRCVDCHDVHSGTTKFSGNELCLQCHKGKIDPGPHSHHEPGTPGGECVDCHMPVTVYMQRHPRRDHGFTIPDPTLTRDLGIPNACNRCHADRSVEWAVEAAQRWYGNRLDRHTQRRARWIAAARAGSDEAISPLLALANDEPSALWRAVATGLLRRWADEEAVQSELVERTRDAHALVRGLAARALEPVVPFAHARVPAALEALLDDPRRSVRVEAAWALRRTVAPFSKAGEDLRAFLRHNRDQPTGRLQQAIYDIDRGYPKTALPHLRRAVVWDPHSAPLRQALAVCLSTLGQSSAAVRELQEACRLAPEEASYRFYLGLGLGELKRYDEAQAAFETAVELDPTFGRAWYNLGLARNSRGLAEDALEALATAGEIDPESPEPPYARATILHAMGRSDEAYEAARRCLEIVPNYEPARHLLGLLDDPSGE